MEGWTGAPSSPLPSPCYYSTLGLSPDSSIDEIRGAYRKLAMQWHPDKWAGMPDLFCEDAKRKFQQIQEAYSVLSDEGKRMLYDVGLYDPHDEHDEGFSDFVLEMLSLMDHVRKEDNAVYTMEDLQSMFMDMVNSDSMGWPYEPPSSLFDCIQSQERVFGKREKHTFPCTS